MFDLIKNLPTARYESFLPLCLFFLYEQVGTGNCDYFFLHTIKLVGVFSLLIIRWILSIPSSKYSSEKEKYYVRHLD